MSGEETRRITEEDRRVAKRLKALYNERKHDLNLNQHKLADAIGATQGYISQCFNQHVALSPTTVIKFAKILETDPVKLDKRTASLLEFNTVVRTMVPVVGTASGRLPDMNSVEVPTKNKKSPTEVALFIDEDMDPFCSKGSLLLVDGDKPLRAKSKFVYRTHKSSKLFAAVCEHSTNDSIRTKDDELLLKKDLSFLARIIAVIEPEDE